MAGEFVPTVHQFVEVLQQFGTKWFDIGIFLEVSDEKLKEIREVYTTHGVVTCLTELYGCLANKGKFTWEDIATALRKLGNNSLAESIHSNYIQPAIRRASSNEDSATCTASTAVQGIPTSNSQVTQSQVITVDIDDKVVDEIGEEFQSLSDQFDYLTIKIRRLFIAAASNVIVDEMQLVVEDKCGLPPLPRSEATVEDVFNRLKKKCSILNFDPLVFAVNTLLSNEETLKIELKNLKASVVCFNRSAKMKNLACLIKSHQPSVHDEHKVVKLKLQDFWNDFTMKLFEDIMKKILGKLYKVLFLISVDVGCICVSWIIPTSVDYTKLLPNPSLEFLQIIGVISLHIGDDAIYNVGEEGCQTLEAAMLQAIELKNTQAIELLLALGCSPEVAITYNGDHAVINVANIREISLDDGSEIGVDHICVLGHNEQHIEAIIDTSGEPECATCRVKEKQIKYLCAQLEQTNTLQQKNKELTQELKENAALVQKEEYDKELQDIQAERKHHKTIEAQNTNLQELKQELLSVKVSRQGEETIADLQQQLREKDDRIQGLIKASEEKTTLDESHRALQESTETLEKIIEQQAAKLEIKKHSEAFRTLQQDSDDGIQALQEQNEIGRLKRTVADLRVLTDNKDREIRKRSEAYSMLQQDCADRIQALQEQNEQLLSQLQTRHRSGSLKDLEEKLVKVEGTNQNLKKANSILREKKEAVDKQVVHMKEEVEFLRSQTESDFLPPPSPQNGASNADLQRQLTGYKAQLAKLKDDNYSLETEGRKTKRNLCLIQEECYKLQNDAERSEQYARRLKKDLEIQIQAHESLKQRPRQDIIVEDSTDLRSREEALRKNWSQLEQEKILVSKKNQELIDARQQHLKEQQQWGEEKNILTMENGELKRTIAHLERACEQLKKSKSQRSMSESQQYTTSQQASSSFSRNRSGDSFQMLLHQQTVMVATLQQQLYQMHNDLKRVEDSNMRYYKAAGNLQTTFTTLKTGTMSTDERAFELLAEKVAEMLNITHQKTPRHNSSPRPSVPSYSAPISSQYPKIAPFSEKTHQSVLDITKLFPSESSDNPCCPHCSYDITTDLQKHIEICPFRK